MKKYLGLVLTLATLCASLAMRSEAVQELIITPEVLSKLSSSSCRAQVLAEIVKNIDKNTRLSQSSAVTCSLGDKKCLSLQAWQLAEAINKNMKLSSAKIYEGYANNAYEQCKDENCRNLQIFNSLKHAYINAFGSKGIPSVTGKNPADSAIQMGMNLYFETSLAAHRIDFNVFVKSCRSP